MISNPPFYFDVLRLKISFAASGDSSPQTKAPSFSLLIMKYLRWIHLSRQFLEIFKLHLGSEVTCFGGEDVGIVLFSPFTRSLKIDLRRGHIIERLVGSLMVVEIEVIINSPSSFGDTLIIPDVDLFILERAP
jgi:hypothetical protein